MKQRNFQKMMTYLAAAYDEEITKDRVAVYWHQLGTLQDEPFEMAVQQHVSHSRYFPTVAELRAGTRQCMQRIEPAPVVKRIEQSKAGMHLAKSHILKLKKRLGA